MNGGASASPVSSLNYPTPSCPKCQLRGMLPSNNMVTYTTEGSITSRFQNPDPTVPPPPKLGLGVPRLSYIVFCSRNYYLLMNWR